MLFSSSFWAVLSAPSPLSGGAALFFLWSVLFSLFCAFQRVQGGQHPPPLKQREREREREREEKSSTSPQEMLPKEREEQAPPLTRRRERLRRREGQSSTVPQQINCICEEMNVQKGKAKNKHSFHRSGNNEIQREEQIRETKRKMT